MEDGGSENCRASNEYGSDGRREKTLLDRI